jgi:hypothetical protein
VQKFLTQVTKFKHVLLTNGVGKKTLAGKNIDIPAGGYRTLDPTAPPFDLQGTKVLTYWDDIHMHQVVHVHHAVRTEGEARVRLESRGYVNATKLERNVQGFWIGVAQKEGRSVHVAVDMSGNVFVRKAGS